MIEELKLCCHRHVRPRDAQVLTSHFAKALSPRPTMIWREQRRAGKHTKRAMLCHTKELTSPTESQRELASAKPVASRPGGCARHLNHYDAHNAEPRRSTDRPQSETICLRVRLVVITIVFGKRCHATDYLIFIHINLIDRHPPRQNCWLRNTNRLPPQLMNVASAARSAAKPPSTCGRSTRRAAPGLVRPGRRRTRRPPDAR